MRDVYMAPGVNPIIERFGGLPQQPKADIASVIGSPDVFPDLQTATAESDRFIARSEHPCELFYSGLTSSYDSAQSIDTIRKLDDVFRDDNRGFDDLTDQNRSIRMGYIEANMWRCLAFGGQFSGAEADEFARDHSFSYWRYVPGDNLYLIEDSGRRGRYYVGKINGAAGLAIIVDGKVTERMSWTEGSTYPEVDPDKLIEFYETIRGDTIFDGTNCPLIELVDPGDDEPVRFLQYHPTRQAVVENQFEIKSPTDTFFVRGSTPPEGVELKLYTRKIHDERKPSEAFGSGSVHDSDAANEYYDPQSDLKVIPGSSREDDSSYRRRFLKATIDHGTRTGAYKPQVTVGVSKPSYEALKAASDRFDGFVEAYIVSNGIAAQLQYYDRQSRSVVTL